MERLKEQLSKKFDIEKELDGWRRPLLFILKSLRLLGYLPFTWNNTGDLQFSLLSTPVAWSVALTSLQIYTVLKLYLWRFYTARLINDFDTTIIIINVFIFVSVSFHGVLASWRSTPRIVKAVNRWISFEKQLSSAVEMSQSSLVPDRAYFGLLIVCAGVVLMFVNSYLKYKRRFAYQIIVDILFGLCLSYYVLFLWLWIVICAMVRTTAELLNRHLIKVLSDSPTPDNILSVRRLWLELHGSTLDLMDGLASTLRLWKTTSFTLTLLTVYALLVVAFIGAWSDVRIVLPALSISCVAGFVLFAASDSTQSKVTDDIIFTICSSKWTALPETSQSQLGLFLDAVEMGSPCFEVQGMFIIDKVKYVSLVFSIITNLVVLMQFKVSTLP